MFKKIIIFSIIFTFYLSFVPSMASYDDLTSVDQMTEPISIVFNIVVSLVGVVFVAVLALGIWKSSMSLGDPRGLEGAKQTWTYALFGLFIIVAFFLLFTFITSILGIKTLTSPADILEKLFDSLNQLLKPFDYY
jgi:hypothetical protein